MLLVCEPLTLVDGSTLVPEFSVTMGFAKHPLSVINLACHVGEHTFPVCLTQEPPSVINSPVLEFDFALAMSKPSEPLPFINRLAELIRVFSVLKLIASSWFQIRHAMLLLG